jgi:hypothetical protein
MTRATDIAATVLLATAMQGCATPTHYAWGSYDDTLYSHYKNPQEREKFVENLKKVLLESEQDGRKVPPGINAEYGYALYEEGQYTEAVVYFQKERDLWPESRVLMEKMIRNAQRQKPATPTPAQGPAGTLEKGKP